MSDDLEVLGLPSPLRSAGPGRWRVQGESLIGDAAATTDLFVDPGSGRATTNAPRLQLAPPDGDFQFSARVEVDFANSYDAGVLLLWADERTWAKLCFEYSPDREPMVVSVVTRGASDDANSFVVDGSAIWLRISRLSGACAFHASTDGMTWRFVRNFSLGGVRPGVGFEVQSPMGAGCSATFAEISFDATTLGDLRDGS